jgi:hypothetical protein
VIVGKLGKQDFTVSCGVVDDIISTYRADKINNCGISGAKWLFLERDLTTIEFFRRFDAFQP